MTATPDGNFMTGVLGYSEKLQQMEFDESSFSWMKSDVEASDTASEQTIVPFAVDLREGQRWVAFSPTARMQPSSFRNGFEKVLNNAVGELGLMPTAWEVDLVTSVARIQEWLQRNPRVFRLTRTIKFTNPGKNLDDDRQEMRNLAANRKTEQFAAPYGKILDIGAPDFEGKLDGTQNGDLDVVMESRGPRGVRSVRFSSRDSVDETNVDDFGLNLQRGVDTVLAALRDYVAQKG